MKKRFLTLLTAALMTGTMLFSGLTVSAKDAKDYLDVSEKEWFYTYVADVSAKNLMTGLNETTFGPAQNLQRSQFVTVLYRMAGSPSTVYEQKFTDVKADQFYSLPITWASKLGVVTGYENKSFGVIDNINREQLATMLFRYAEKSGEDVSGRASLSSFPDGKNVSVFAKDAMEWAVHTKIISGNSNGTLAPQDNVNRAVCATMISRYSEMIDVPTEPVVDTWEEGTYEVGKDMPAGEYILVVNEGEEASPYFQVSSSEESENEEAIISSDIFKTYSIVTVEEGQFFGFAGCTAYTIDKEGVELDTTKEGMFKVGQHLKAGRYKINAVEKGYYEVTSTSKHDEASIETSGNIDAGNAYVTVADGQYLKMTGCQIVTE